MRSTANNLPNSIWRRTLFAMSFALTINIILYYGGQLFLPNGYLVLRGPGAPPEPLPFAAVVFTTAIVMFAGAVVYWLAETFVTQTPSTTFTIIAAVVLIFSLSFPIWMAVGFLTKILLSLMHIVTAASLVWFLTR